MSKRSRTAVVALALTALAGLAGVVAITGFGRALADTDEYTPVALTQVPEGRVAYDSVRGELTLEMLPTEIPCAHDAHGGMIAATTVRVDIPMTGYINSIRTEIVDSTGQVSPMARLHHFNIIDPERRELFAPISLRLYASGKETPKASVPKYFLGMPLIKGQRVMLKAMLYNGGHEPIPKARMRVILGYSKGGSAWPVYRGYPVWLDVLFPVGAQDGIHSFDLPPGHSEKAYQAKPAVSGKLVLMGGHLHDLGQYVEFKDVTANRVIWHGAPTLAKDGTVSTMPYSTFYRGYTLGPHLTTDHTYEVRVVYENPTPDTIHFGGMGAVGGFFIPDGDARWPKVDTTNAAYRTDITNELRDDNTIGEMASMGGHSHMMMPGMDMPGMSMPAAPAKAQPAVKKTPPKKN